VVNEEILENEIVDMFGNRLNQHYKSIDFEGNEYYNLPKSYYGLIKLEYYANNPEDESRYKLMDRFKIDVLVNNYMIVRKRLFNSDLPLDHHDIQTLMKAYDSIVINDPKGHDKEYYILEISGYLNGLVLLITLDSSYEKLMDRLDDFDLFLAKDLQIISRHELSKFRPIHNRFNRVLTTRYSLTNANYDIDLMILFVQGDYHI